MFLSLITVVLAMPIRFILPIFAKDVFMVGPDRLGYLGGVMGLGALGGTLVIAGLGKVARRGLALAVSGILSGLTLLGFAAMSYFAPTYIAGLAILALVGLIQAARMTLNSSLMMEYAEQEYRGRVMSLFSLVMGIMPAGVLPITVMTDQNGRADCPWYHGSTAHPRGNYFASGKPAPETAGVAPEDEHGGTGLSQAAKEYVGAVREPPLQSLRVCHLV